MFLAGRGEAASGIAFLIEIPHMSDDRTALRVRGALETRYSPLSSQGRNKWAMSWRWGKLDRKPKGLKSAVPRQCVSSTEARCHAVDRVSSYIVGCHKVVCHLT